NLRHTDTGFHTDRLIQFQLNTGAAGYNRERSTVLFHQILDNLRAIPGVHSATLTVTPVLSNSMIGFAPDVEGYTHGERESRGAAGNAVAPGYFGMLGIPIVRGRDFAEADTSNSQRVAIVGESFVKKYFQNREPL